MPRKSAQLQTVHEPEVVGQSEHLELVRSLQDGITTFFRSAVVFFDGASVLREDAKLMVSRAEALTVPTDDASDKIVQRVVIDSTRGRKANTEHWEPITKTFHRVHKALTSGRGEAEKDFVRAAGIGKSPPQRLCGRGRTEGATSSSSASTAWHVRPRSVNGTKRIDGWRKERLNLEADSPNLSDREQRFVNAFDQHANTVRAERMAGYKAGYGAKLLEREKIQKALELMVKTREVARQQEVVKKAPVVPKATAVVRSSIGHVVGGGSRKQRGAEIYDEDRLIETILSQAANPPPEGEPIIPTDILSVKQPRVNEYARKLGSSINEWPGVRYTEQTKVTGS